MNVYTHGMDGCVMKNKNKKKIKLVTFKYEMEINNILPNVRIFNTKCQRMLRMWYCFAVILQYVTNRFVNLIGG